jgi:hypothetical protein
MTVSGRGQNLEANVFSTGEKERVSPPQRNRNPNIDRQRKMSKNLKAVAFPTNRKSGESSKGSIQANARRRWRKRFKEC